MTITISNQTIRFEELSGGDLFISKKYSDEEQVYMRMEELVRDFYDTRLNTVNLHTGEPYWFYGNDEVEPITASLNIKRS